MSISTALLFFPLLSAAAAAAPPVELRDGDRVVLVGGTFIEREQAYGYLETLIATRLPDRNITFRNLGWSGDTVRGTSRARFGPEAEGFQHLKDHVLALKPTVILVCYGANEAFEGPEGATKFQNELNTLLDTPSPTGARLVLIAPYKQEPMGPPLPDPTAYNRNLAQYRDILRATAEKRGAGFVDLYDGLKTGSSPGDRLTENGVHLNATGYLRVAEILAASLGAPAPAKAERSVEIRSSGKVVASHGVQIAEVAKQGSALRIKLSSEHGLTEPSEPSAPRKVPAVSKEKGADDSIRLTVRGLPAKPYTVRLDGKPALKVVGPDVTFYLSSALDQARVDSLRSVINDKNQLYFHRWRPQNETYLYGFRKHEQGQNAREIPLFDPLVAEREAKIAILRVPQVHTVELIEGEVDR